VEDDYDHIRPAAPEPSDFPLRAAEPADFPDRAPEPEPDSTSAPAPIPATETKRFPSPYRTPDTARMPSPFRAAESVGLPDPDPEPAPDTTDAPVPASPSAPCVPTPATVENIHTPVTASDIPAPAHNPKPTIYISAILWLACVASALFGLGKDNQIALALAFVFGLAAFSFLTLWITEASRKSNSSILRVLEALRVFLADEPSAPQRG
jgi:hypothetical protein